MKSKLAITAGVAVLGYAAATPYITATKIKQAVEQKDAVALDEYVDFPAVRQSLKEQLKAVALKEFATDTTLAEDPFAAVGTALVGVVVDNVIDTVVTPAGVTQLATTGLPKFDPETGELTAATPATGPIVQDSSMSYDSLSTFSIRIKDRDGVEGRLVLRREGLFSWRLRDVQIQQDGQSSLFASGQAAHEPAAALAVAEGPAEDATSMAAALDDVLDVGLSEQAEELSYSDCMERAGGVTYAMHECASSELERQDARLNSAYKAAMATTEQKEALRDVQRQWITDRDRECEAEAAEFDGGTLYGVIHTDCMIRLTSKRADELERLG